MEKEEKTQEETGSEALLAVVRVRGLVNLRHDTKSTFEHLNLHNKNWCVILTNTPSIKGMVTKVKDYITWGEISKETLEELVKKRGEVFKDRTKDNKSKIEYSKFIVLHNTKYKRFFRLSPPKKGYGMKGVKETFTNRGALGYRGEKINDLLKRMI